MNIFDQLEKYKDLLVAARAIIANEKIGTHWKESLLLSPAVLGEIEKTGIPFEFMRSTAIDSAERNIRNFSTCVERGLTNVYSVLSDLVMWQANVKREQE